MGSRKDGEEQRHDERLDIDEGTKKVLDLLIAERIAYLQEKRKKEHPEEGQQEAEWMEAWEALIRERDPELLEESEALLDDLIAIWCRASGALYRAGIEDGIRLMRAWTHI